MENKTELTKKCPKCGNNQMYKNIEQYKKGIKLNRLCRVCCDKEKRADLTDKKYGRLLVLSYAGNGKWKCQCECGQVKNICTPHLKSGETKSCGCWRKEISERGHKPFQSLYKRLLWKCKKEKQNISLTFDDFLQYTITTKCHYCGDEIVWHGRNRGRYNLDRKDNSIGYTKDNCVVCCKECNYAKSTFFTYKEMLIIGKAIGEVKTTRLTDCGNLINYSCR